MMKYLSVAVLLLGLSDVALASEAESHGHSSTAPATQTTPAIEEVTHPTVPPIPCWSKTVVGLIAVLFVAAIPIGVFLRASLPEETEPADAHDDPGHDAHAEQGGHH